MSCNAKYISSIIVVLTIFFHLNNSSAQGIDKDEKLWFQISQASTLDDFQSCLIYDVTKRNTIRAGVSYVFSDKYDQSNQDAAKLNLSSTYIVGEFLYHFHSTEKLQVHLGVGAQMSIGNVNIPTFDSDLKIELIKRRIYGPILSCGVTFKLTEVIRGLVEVEYSSAKVKYSSYLLHRETDELYLSKISNNYEYISFRLGLEHLIL